MGVWGGAGGSRGLRLECWTYPHMKGSQLLPYLTLDSHSPPLLLAPRPPHAHSACPHLCHVCLQDGDLLRLEQQLGTQVHCDLIVLPLSLYQLLKQGSEGERERLGRGSGYSAKHSSFPHRVTPSSFSSILRKGAMQERVKERFSVLGDSIVLSLREVGETCGGREGA